MRNVLLATAVLVAAAALPAAPAGAQSRSQGFSSSSESSFASDFRRDDRRRDRRNRDSDVFIGEWPQQGDTAWRSNSFNDWWHDQPHRAYPAWMQRNQKCERMWWSGGDWRC